MTRQIQKTCELAWAAGFFDGEGCTTVRLQQGRTGNWNPILRIFVTQKEREPLERFQRAVGGLGGIYKHRAGHHIFAVGKRDDVHFILENLWPFLCNAKRKQANRAIGFDNANRSALPSGRPRKVAQ
jgi:hypothetical protein